VASGEQTAPPPPLELEADPDEDPLEEADDDPDDDADDDPEDDDDDPDDNPEDDDADDDPDDDPEEDPLDDPADCPESVPPDDDPLEPELPLASFPPASAAPSPAWLFESLSRPLVLTRSEHPAVPPSQQRRPQMPAWAPPRAGQTLLLTIFHVSFGPEQLPRNTEP
jgi:hypothetical protein